MKLRNVLFASCMSLVSTCHIVYAANDNLSAEQVLTKVDQYRNFKNTAFSFDLTLVAEEKDKEPKEFSMHAAILDSHTSLVSYTLPVREQGKAILMNGKNLWFFSKTAAKPIRITPQQRLLGEASNGDVASTDFSGDYVPSFATDKPADAATEVVLQLDAKDGSMAAYKRLFLWVDKKTSQPKKAEFYAESGKQLKTAYYTQFAELKGFDNKTQLVELEIHNSLVEGNITRMRYTNFKLEKLSENQFRPEQISSLLVQ